MPNRPKLKITFLERVYCNQGTYHFMSYSKKKKAYYQPHVKPPIRLQYGIVETEEEKELKNRVRIPEKVQFAEQKIVGTLILKKIDYKNVSPLKANHMERIKNNLKKIYEESQLSKSSNKIDSDPDSPQVLAVTFNYNQTCIDRIKGLDRNERAWDPEKKQWRIFIGCFDEIFDILGKNIVLTKACYENLLKFVIGRYYANMAVSKMGKLIIRESWYEEIDDGLFDVEILPGSTLANSTEYPFEIQNKIQHFKNLISQFTFQRKPYSHQISGIEFLMMNSQCALLDEMGCGKSFQIASAISILLSNHLITKVLVVAPKSLIHTWQYELSLATKFSYQVIEGNPSQRKKCLDSSSQIFLIHYEGLRLEQEALEDWVENGETMIVFDESQRIKNIEAKTTIASKLVRNNAKRCVIATGTPIANRPMDLFAQYLVMDNGKTFGSNFSLFKNTYCEIEIIEIPAGRRKIRVEKFIGVKNSQALQKRIQATSLRRLKEDVLDLPPIIYKDYFVELSAEQKSFYMKVRDNVKSEIELLSSHAFQSQKNNIVVKLLRLSQISSNPFLVDKKFHGTNSKFNELDSILNDVFEDDTKKVILWSHFVENIKFLQTEYFEKWGAISHTGEMNLAERQVSISEFQDNPSARLFIATPQSAKEGLTLLPKDGRMKADTMIYLDLNFDASSYIQSQARFHRIGQTAEKCLVIHLIGQNTIDNYIRRTLVDKMRTASLLVDNKDKDFGLQESEPMFMDKENVLKLFQDGQL